MYNFPSNGLFYTLSGGFLYIYIGLDLLKLIVKFLYIRVGDRKNPLHTVSALDAPSNELSKRDVYVNNGRDFSISF